MIAEHFTQSDVVMMYMLIVSLLATPVVIALVWVGRMILRRKAHQFEIAAFLVYLVLAGAYYVWLLNAMSWKF